LTKFVFRENALLAAGSKRDATASTTTGWFTIRSRRFTVDRAARDRRAVQRFAKKALYLAFPPDR
jgi:hypothetical protein